jgi:hypothetical protein
MILETIDYYTFVGAGMAVAFIGLLAVTAMVKKPLTVWHWLTIGAVSGFTASIVQSYTQLFDWIALGFTGASTAASLFVLGMGSMIVVMIYNLIATRGRTMVR